MNHQHPTGYCCVCGSQVTVNIHGTATSHVYHRVTCPGSELGMDLKPTLATPEGRAAYFDQLVAEEAHKLTATSGMPRHARGVPSLAHKMASSLRSTISIMKQESWRIGQLRSKR